MPHRPRVLSLATANPPHVLRQEDVRDFARSIFPDATTAIDRLLPVYANAGIATRYSCMPIGWYADRHGWKDRQRLFVDNALDLGEIAAREALDKAGLGPSDVDAVVAVSTSGVATPSLDALLIERMGLRCDVARLPIFGLGCGGGVIGLARAADLAVRGNVLFVVVELCGLTFRRNDVSKSNIIATALFGDGAAAAVIAGGGGDDAGPTIVDSGEHTWAGTLDVMGWRVEEDGFGVLFSRDIPSLVLDRFDDALAGYLGAHDRTLADYDGFVCHPGGAKVVAALERVMGLQTGTMREARTVLRDFGNMSAATVLFVLDRVLANGARGRYLMSALGPGFTAGFLTLEI